MILQILALAIGLTPIVDSVNSEFPRAADDANSVCGTLRRGINLGNALEAPSEGAWGMRLEESYFRAIAEAGFSSVRIPVRWSAHAEKVAPYAIDTKFTERVAWAVDQSLKNGLAVVLNFHHYEKLYAEPDTQADRFLALWKQVADQFKDRPHDQVVFEILNEPHGQLDAGRWNALLPRALQVIREIDPTRVVMVGPAQWNNLRALKELQLPEADRRLIVTFHYYDPFPFTHQGASWAGADARKWLGKKWAASGEDLDRVQKDFDAVKEWAESHDRPICLGEFGAYEKADMESRASWTRAIAREAETRGFAWSYWEFGAGFGAFDRSKSAWRKPLLDALVPRDRL